MHYLHLLRYVINPYYYVNCNYYLVIGAMCCNQHFTDKFDDMTLYAPLFKIQQIYRKNGGKYISGSEKSTRYYVLFT